MLDQLHDVLSPDFRRRIDREAGHWFAREGWVDEALKHWIAADEIGTAAELVGAKLDSVIVEDMSRRQLGAWLALFPPQAMDRRLPLIVADGYRRIVRWDVPGLERRLRGAELLDGTNTTRRHRDRDPALSADLDVQRSFCRYWRGEPEASLRHARHALDARPRPGSMAWTLGTMYRSGSLALLGRFSEGMRHLDSAVAELPPGSPHLAALLYTQAVLSFNTLDLEVSRSKALLVLELNEGIHFSKYWVACTHHLLGLVAYEKNLLDEAEKWFRRVEDLRDLRRQPDLSRRSAWKSARVVRHGRSTAAR